MEHPLLIVCCDFKPLSLTLVRARLWPASSYYPRYVFSFNLLDWAELLLLECQVALKDFCQALYFRCPYSIVKVMTTIQYILIFVTVYCSVFFMCSNILFHREEIFIAVSLIHLRNIGS